MEYLGEMWSGQGHLRIIIQPLIAILLGARDGINDAQVGRPPYILSLLNDPKARMGNLAQALRRLAVPLTLGIGMSLLFQWIVRGEVHLVLALAFGVFLIALPYSVARALSNRVAAISRHHRAARPR